MKGETALLRSELPAPPDIDMLKPRKTKNSGNGRYKGYTARILNGNILEVTVFTQEKVPVFRTFINDREEYISQYIENGSLETSKRSTAKLYNDVVCNVGGTYRYWHSSIGTFITDESNRARAVEWLDDKFAGEPDVFKQLCEHMEWIGEQKRKERNERIRRSINDLMLQIKPLPSDFDKWIDDVPYRDNRYIMYEYSKKKETTGYCTHCRQHVTVVGAKHQKRGKCPNCRSAVTYLASGKVSVFRVERDLKYLQPGKNGEIIIRHLWNIRYFEKTGNTLRCSDHRHENLRIFYNADTCYEYSSNYGGWRHAGHGEYYEGYIYPNNVKKLLCERIDEKLKYIPFTRLLKNLPPVIGRNFLQDCKESPQIEYFAKLKLYRLCADHINCKIQGEHERGNLLKQFGLKKTDLAYIQKMNMDYRELLLYGKYKKYGRDVYEQMLRISNKYGYQTENRVGDLMELMPLITIKSYVNSQIGKRKKPYYCGRCSDPQREEIRNIISDWCDYIENCKELGWNLKDTKVIRPANLEERHNLSVDIKKLRKMQVEDSQIQQRYYQHIFDFAYRNKEFSVTMPRDLLDLRYEGDCLEHCVFTNYAARVADGRSIILFVRRNSEFYKPLGTVEIDPNTLEVIQIRGYKNDPVKPDVKAFFEAYKIKVLAKIQKKERKAA